MADFRVSEDPKECGGASVYSDTMFMSYEKKNDVEWHLTPGGPDFHSPEYVEVMTLCDSANLTTTRPTKVVKPEEWKYTVRPRNFLFIPPASRDGDGIKFPSPTRICWFFSAHNK